jgi:hypothetical protein
MNGCCADKPYGTGCTPRTCMQLPEGETCGTCAHHARCQMLFQCEASRETCDFFPRRFRSVATKPGTP